MREWISGRNPVYETLRAKRRHVFRLVLARGIKLEGQLPEILRLARLRGLAPEEAPRDKLDALSNHHQGVALEASEYPYAALEDLIQNARNQPEPPFFLLLDLIQDPQNLGTLLRTAEAVGIHGLGELNLSKIVRISFALHFLGTFFGIGRFNARCCSQAVSQVVFVGFGQPEAIQAGFPLFSAKIIATRIV